MGRDKLILIAIVASWPIAGLIEPFTPSYGRAYNEVTLVHSVVLAFLLFAWCKEHATARGIKPPTGAAVLCALIAPIGLPYYFFRSYPWRRALRSLGKALLILLLCIFLYAGGLYVGSLLAA